MRRKIGFLVLGSGVLLLAWLAVTIWWGDPITSAYTAYEQHRLSSRLAHVDDEWVAGGLPVRGPSIAALTAAGGTPAVDRTRRTANAYARTLKDGAPVGRIIIPRIHLDMVVVQGTSESDLSRGPGHYDAASGESTGLPGMKRVIAIAGHRTTYLHPFRHIDDLQSGDKIYLLMPYGTFTYTVFFHKVVSSDDWSILRPRRFEKLVLSACHPLYSASHRWVVFARATPPKKV
jgi:sortase A